MAFSKKSCCELRRTKVRDSIEEVKVYGFIGLVINIKHHIDVDCTIMWANLSYRYESCAPYQLVKNELRVHSNIMFNLTIIKYHIRKQKSYFDSMCNDTYKPTKSCFQQKCRLFVFKKYDPNVAIFRLN